MPDFDLMWYENFIIAKRLETLLLQLRRAAITYRTTKFLEPENHRKDLNITEALRIW